MNDLSRTQCPTNWQPLHGEFSFSEDRIEFKGKPYRQENQEEGAAAGIAMCDVYFGGGRISLDFQFETSDFEPAVRVVLYREPTRAEILTAGTGGQTSLGTFAIGRFVPANELETKAQWITLGHSGYSHLEANRRYHLEVEQRGATIDVFLDAVHVLRTQRNYIAPVTQCGLFFLAKSNAVVTSFRITQRPRVAFVVMQFSPEYDALYSDVIKPVAEKAGYNVVRADEVYGPGVILADILQKLVEAELIIAEITPKNPNVFYEVGFAHAIGKPTILIKEIGEALPFDLSPFRTLFYENSIAGKSRVESSLRQHLEAIQQMAGRRM